MQISAARASRAPLLVGMTAAILALAVAVQVRGGLNLDVSWFITFAERTRAGARPYIDISDPNPPASILMYMPALVVAGWTGLKVEALVVAQTLGLLLGAIALTRRIQPNARSNDRFTVAALIALAITPAAMFAEREHYAAVACLPAVAVIVALGRGAPVGARVRFLAGCAGALTIAFKPHFAAALAVPALYTTIRRRSLGWISWLEIAGFALVIGAYVAAAALAYPAYFTTALPEAIRLYAAAHASFSMALSSETMWFMLAIVTAATALALANGLSEGATGAGLASVGFAAAYFVQQRYQLNHASAAIETASIAVLEGLATSATRPLLVNAALACLAVVAPLFLRINASLTQAMGEPNLVASVRKLLPPNGRLAAISDSLELTFPAARLTGAVWTYRYNSEWRYATARWILDNQRPDAATTAFLNSVIDSDRAQLAEDIVRGKPDVIVIDSPAVRQRETEGSPAIAAALASYRFAGHADTSIGPVELWRRTPPD